VASEREGPHEDVIDEAVRDAQALGEDGRWEEAYDRLSETLRDEGDDAVVLCWLGIASERLGRDGEAYDHFRRCLALEPGDPFVLATAGSGLATFDDPEAESALRLAALTAPDFSYARMAYGGYLAREGMVAEALTELEAARGLAPDDAGVRVELGIALLLAGRTADALAELEEALAREQEDAWVRGLYGLALVDAGRPQDGAEELHRASLERPSDVDLHLASALASAAEGWDDEAWNALARAEQAAEPEDRDAIEEVEDRLHEGADEAGEFLKADFAPTLLHERLLQRP
jgi:Flp pilus assembly protein TadD